MSEVFLSYRQTDDAQMQRVRTFGERLRDSGVDVLLDQFFKDDNAGGPDEGWDKWSSKGVLKSDYVLIIGTKEWFDCFEGNQPPGTGLGAACEADDIRHLIYKSAGVIKNIRVVLFEDVDAAHIPAKLYRYHRFHADRDFADIVRWLKPRVITSTPRTVIPHNLPSLQPFFGREEELRKIADALDPESRTWGALIDGPGGMGKTSLAVRAAYDVLPEHFEKMVFVSLKPRELDDDGVRVLSGFLISGIAELLNELARQLGHADVAKASEEQRPRMLLDVLSGTCTLLVLDNLESLLKRERDVVFNFVKRLPSGCKAILTSRGRIGSAAEELILEKLDERAALDTLAKLAESSPALAKTSEAERRELYRETSGKPLLLRWTAGQIGRGSCLTLADAIGYLRSCPEGNDPLEFIFGDLVEDFDQSEMRVLCALTYFTLPARVEHIAEIAECSSDEADSALRSLVNRSLVVPSEELKNFTLVPLVADFLQKKKPEVIEETGGRLEKRALALVMENGYHNYERFHMLHAAWPTVAAALPRFIDGENRRLQNVVNALFRPCHYGGRYDELIALNQDAESRAISAGDFLHAGWRAHQAGAISSIRGQSAEVLDCADRAESHWRKAQVGTHETATALHLQGIGHELSGNYTAAVAVYLKAVDLWRTSDGTTEDVVIGLNSLAKAELLSNYSDGAERHFREALELARTINYREGIASITGNLGLLAIMQNDLIGAEALAREALQLSEAIGSQELIARDCQCLAQALARQRKTIEALPYAKRAVEIFTRLAVPDLEAARETLTECERE